MKKGSRKVAVVGVDLGDGHCQVCAVDKEGDRVKERRITTTEKGLRSFFEKLGSCRVVMEAGTVARWAKDLIEGMGHSVKVVDPRKMRRIYENENKSDVVDARELADAGLYRWGKLPAVRLRSRECQEKLAVLRARDVVVKSRSSMVALVRSLLKQEGIRVKKCSTEAFPKQAGPVVPPGLAAAVDPLLSEIAVLTVRVKEFDKWIEQQVSSSPEAQCLRQVKGVGPITSAAFLWTIGVPERFRKSRTVGAYLGLKPRRDQSGESDPQLPITKAGNPFLRRLLVGSVHYILGPFGPDTALKRWGEKLAARGGKRAKRKAVVAVARKLAVILHHLWVTGEVYQPFPGVREAAA